MFFWSLSNTKSKGSTHVLLNKEKFGNALAEEGNFILIYEFKNGVKPEKFEYLRLVYHFTVPASVSKYVDIDLLCSVKVM